MVVRGRPSHSFLGVLAALLLVLAAPLARASVVPLSLEQLVAISDEVHTVKVESTNSYFFEGKIFTTAKLDIFESFKGEMTGHAEISYPGGTVRMIGMKSDTGMENVQAGQYGVLFLSYPLNQVTDQERARFNSKSPAVMSPQLVGGFQGRFDLKVFPGTVPTDSPAARASLLHSAVVSREKIGAARSTTGQLQGVSYPDFSATLHSLATEEKTMRANRATPKQINGIRGEFFVPERRENNAVARFCDPLPPLAYVSKEEYERIRAQAQDSARAAQAIREKTQSGKAAVPAATQQNEEAGK